MEIRSGLICALPFHPDNFFIRAVTDANELLNIAHRGASGRLPENTVSAFRAAIEAGAAMCELDVRLSRDGVAMVIHDETVGRTTEGRGAVAAMSREEIQRLNVRHRDGVMFHDERVPTLQEVFELTHARCGLDIELKVSDAGAAALGLIRIYNEFETSIISSFDWNTLDEIRRQDGRVRVGLLADARPNRLMESAVAMNAFAIVPSAKLAAAELIASAHRRRLKVYVWTVDDPDAMRRLIAIGIDGIITNYPERLAAVMRE